MGKRYEALFYGGSDGVRRLKKANARKSKIETFSINTL